ncbi:MAG: hypothetical protein M1823_004053 [Watsoniomyces obsoletus]|nr:MAG: hypothetical protein M1823_004053 [Watsoniomyces obsoletus]
MATTLSMRTALLHSSPRCLFRQGISSTRQASLSFVRNDVCSRVQTQPQASIATQLRWQSTGPTGRRTPTQPIPPTPDIAYPNANNASTTPSTTLNTTTTQKPNSHISSIDPKHRLDWNTFFRLRKVRRRYDVVSSVFTSAGGLYIGFYILSNYNLDTSGGNVFGLDPFVFLGLGTVAFGALGWLVGPSAGNAVFGLIYRRHAKQMAQKEKGLYARIKLYRVDPSAQSFANPVPDYYGEKIGSVAGYRQWLKDQRAYNRKKFRPTGETPRASAVDLVGQSLGKATDHI